jgi:tetratricopeptide (TPR) repeat protein
MRVLALLSLSLSVCAPQRDIPPPNELVVVPVSGSATPIVAPSPRASGNVLPPAPPAVVAPIAMRMRDALLASASAQGAGGLDLQLFQDGFDRERADDLAGARKAYYELITQVPTSPLVPYAYLAFGDLFFAEAERGSPDKFPLAKQAYEKVIYNPPPGNRAYAYAVERLGACDLRSGDHARALSNSKKALDATRAYPSLPLSSEVAESARKNLVEAYVAAGQPDRAPAFFRAADPQMASAMVVELGDRYAQKGASRDVLALYANALAAGRDATICAGARAAVQSLAKPQGNADVVALEAKRSAACGP